MKKIKVLYVAHDSSLYGSNRSLINLIVGLRDRIEPIVLIPDSGSVIKVLEDLNIAYHIVDYRYTSGGISALSILKYLPTWVKNYFANKKALKTIASIFSGKEIDLVHSNSGVITIGFELANMLSIKHIWHIREFQDLDHNLYPFGGKRRFTKKLMRSDLVITISKSVARHFNLEQYSTTIYNGVKSKEFVLPLVTKSDYFLFCGVLKRSKGIDQAIKALSKYIKIHKHDTKLIVLGIAPNVVFRLYLQLIVRFYKVSKNVQFVGFAANTESYMKEAMAVLMCSQNEAMGRVTPEAMFCGCPVIGYKSMGTAEIISDKVNGFLYKNIDEMVEIMAYVKSQTNSPTLNSIISKAYLDAKDEYSEEGYAAKIYTVYLDLVELPQ